MNVNWIALYLAIVKEIKVSKALSIMKLSSRKKSCANSSIQNFAKHSSTV